MMSLMSLIRKMEPDRFRSDILEITIPECGQWQSVIKLIKNIRSQKRRNRFEVRV